MKENNQSNSIENTFKSDREILEADIILTVALPGAGKSTWAKKIKAQDPDKYIIVERDEIRETLFGAEYATKDPVRYKESQVTAVHSEIIDKALSKGKKVIVSDTHMNTRAVSNQAQTAKRLRKKIDLKYFNVSVEECKRRNRLRGESGGRFVPEEVIDRMASKTYDTDGNIKEYIIGKNGEVFSVSRMTEGMKDVAAFDLKANRNYPFKGKSVAIIDMDGSLFNNAKDSKFYLENKANAKKDFKGFYDSIENAPVNRNVLEHLRNLRKDGVNIIAITGRSDDNAKVLISAIERSGAPITRLIMKRDKDGRPSSEHKKDTLLKLQKEGFIVVQAIDDRAQDIKMFRSAGVPVTVVEVPYIDLDNIQEVYEDPKINLPYEAGYCIRCGSKLKDPNKTIGDKCRTKA